LSRHIKQFIYGAVYLGILALIIFGVSFSRQPELTCFDGLWNQNEEETDCGGVCGACAAPEPLYIPLEVKNVDFTVVLDTLFFTGEVYNRNPEHGLSRFSYAVEFAGEDDVIIATFPGTASVRPDAVRVVYGSVTDSELAKVAARVRLVVGTEGLAWEEGSPFVPGQVILEGAPEVSYEDDRITVSGVIKNTSRSLVPEVAAVVVFYNDFGFSFLTSGTTVARLRPLATREFVVVVPSDAALLRRVETARVEVFLYPEK